VAAGSANGHCYGSSAVSSVNSSAALLPGCCAAAPSLQTGFSSSGAAMHPSGIHGSDFGFAAVLQQGGVIREVTLLLLWYCLLDSCPLRLVHDVDGSVLPQVCSLLTHERDC
jgi:hypothetical protein